MAKPIRICPKCGGKTRYYHSPGVTRCVCKGTCPPWTVIEEIDHNKSLHKEQNAKNI